MKKKFKLTGGLVLALVVSAFIVTGTAYAEDAQEEAKKDGNPVKGLIEGTGETIAGLGEGTGKVLKGAAEGTGEAVKGAGEETGKVLEGAGKGTQETYENVTK
ncbi:MAG: hypothetical protein HY586_06630 [Candidatus Omnitrophica bacterium]|nr:hypothetical protein [Candidatus Omnitrophota bacterium]